MGLGRKPKMRENVNAFAGTSKMHPVYLVFPKEIVTTIWK
jgi:hypothetical protein